MNYLTLTVVEPAPINISSKINRVGIINRSVVNGKNEKIDKVDKVLSLEGKNFDKEGSQAAVMGVFDQLVNPNRFSDVKIIDSVVFQSPGLGIYPAALPWDKIEQLCKERGVDAIFELSSYDTDTRISYKAEPININGPLGVKIPAIEHHATVVTVVKIGWRVYDAIHKVVLDEYLVNESVSTTGVGVNPVKALEAVLGRKESVLQVSGKIGSSYATRIFPYNLRVTREYYVRGTDSFKVAKRRALTGDWNGAAELWSKEVVNAKTKIAGRACYNMAIINEINGDLNVAIDWASKAYTDYGNKNALRYLNILKYRLSRNNQLNSQGK